MSDPIARLTELLAKVHNCPLYAEGKRAHENNRIYDEYTAASYNLMPKILEALRWGQAVADYVTGGPGLGACIDRLRDAHNALRSAEDAKVTPTLSCRHCGHDEEDHPCGGCYCDEFEPDDEPPVVTPCNHPQKFRVSLRAIRDRLLRSRPTWDVSEDTKAICQYLKERGIAVTP